MTWLTLAAGAALAMLAVVFLARPFLREPSPAEDRIDGLDPAAQRRLELAEQRDRALAALKELEFDHRTGKVSDEDYRALVGSLRRSAARALRALEPPELPREPYPPPGELDPPQPPEIPEPYPPPDEADPPTQPRIPEPYPEQSFGRDGGRALDAGRSSR
jgi:hypothetical protein